MQTLQMIMKTEKQPLIVRESLRILFSILLSLRHSIVFWGSALIQVYITWCGHSIIFIPPHSSLDLHMPWGRSGPPQRPNILNTLQRRIFAMHH